MKKKVQQKPGQNYGGETKSQEEKSLRQRGTVKDGHNKKKKKSFDFAGG